MIEQLNNMVESENQKQFEAATKNGVTIVDFFATWCGPCRMMSMIIEEINEEHPDFNIVKVDVDTNETLARKFGVLSIPTIVILKDGKLVEKHVGLMQKEDLVDLVESYLQF